VDGGSTIGADVWKAMLVTTGSSPTQLASVVVGLNPTSTNNAFTISVVPEPSLLALLAMGAVGSWWAFRGRRRRRDGRRDGNC
jgi:hypothetical protein